MEDKSVRFPGSDFGIVVKDEHGDDYIVKVGIARSLFTQILDEHQRNPKKFEDLVGYAVSAHELLLKHHESFAAIKAELPDLPTLKNNLKDYLEEFLAEPQTAKLSEAKNFSINDLQQLYKWLIQRDSQLKNVLGLPIIMDVVNEVAGQYLVNHYQEQHRDAHVNAPAQLMMVGDPHADLLIGSKILQDAKPFDQMLMAPYLPAGTDLRTVLEATRLIRHNDKGVQVNKQALDRAEQLVNTIIDEKNLERGEAQLRKELPREGVKGFFASLMLRLTLGESANLGPDGMLWNPKAENEYGLANINIAGFRYSRKNDFIPPVKPGRTALPARLGWQKIFNDPANALAMLTDSSVLSQRYSEGLPAVHASIMNVIEGLSGHLAQTEVESVIRFYANLNLVEVESTFNKMRQQISAKLDPNAAPDANLLEITFTRTLDFIRDLHDTASKICHQRAQEELRATAQQPELLMV